MLATCSVCTEGLTVDSQLFRVILVLGELNEDNWTGLLLKVTAVRFADSNTPGDNSLSAV